MDGTSFKMISFISGTLLTEEPYCKFMLKRDTKNYFHNLGKLVFSETQHAQTS